MTDRKRYGTRLDITALLAIESSSRIRYTFIVKVGSDTDHVDLR